MAVRAPLNATRFGRLEVLAHAPSDEPHAVPILFVHGAYADAWCWAENFLPWFAVRGWAAYAVSLSGHGASDGREHLDSWSIADYVRDVAEVVAHLPTPPVLVGHSMGGMVIQKYLEQASAPAVVLMASVPPQGLLGSMLGLSVSRPGLMRDLNRLLGGRQLPLETLREALFAQPIGADKLLHYLRHIQPESARALWDMTLFNLPHVSRMHRPPMLILGAGRDQLISVSDVQATARSFDLEAEIFSDMGHGLMLERDWRKVAERIDLWLKARLNA